MDMWFLRTGQGNMKAEPRYDKNKLTINPYKNINLLQAYLVRVKGLEPSQSCPHKNLNLTRLPIPPNPHMKLHHSFLLGVVTEAVPKGRSRNRQPLRCLLQKLRFCHTFALRMCIADEVGSFRQTRI